MSLCLASAGIVKVLSIAAFTLAWTHSIEKSAWQEDWLVTPAGLTLQRARVKGTGAGMEPPGDPQLPGDVGIDRSAEAKNSHDRGDRKRGPQRARRRHALQ